MSEMDFEAYLALLSRFLRLNVKQREDIRRELRAHLEDAIEAEIADGATRDEAVLRVLDDFGDAAELAARFSSVGRKQRWIMKGTMAAACIGLCVFLFNMFSPQAPPLAVAVTGADNVETVGSNQGEELDEALYDKIDAADRAIEEALARNIPEVTFDKAPLEAVLDWFKEFFGMNMHVRWSNLEDSTIYPDDPVSINLQDVTAERALRLVLEDAGGGDLDLGYEIDEGILIIATRERLQRRLITEVYSVTDLLDATVAYNREGKYGVSPNTSTQPQSSPVPPGELLTDLITETIEPDSWAKSGDRGTQEVFNGILVVRQTLDVHRQIDCLLNDLREAGAAEVK